MVVLKKIRSSSLIEVLVATVLIVVVFIVASLIMNQLFMNVFKNNTHSVENRIYELEYQLIHQQLMCPYEEDIGLWHIEIDKNSESEKKEYSIVAKNKETNREIISYVTYVE